MDGISGIATRRRVLQAAAMGEGGEIFVLDMGKPVRIVDLARKMVLLSGFRPEEDIRIVYSGLRPGEKLSEELFYSSEVGTKKVHDKIFRASRKPQRQNRIQRDLQTLEAVIDGDKEEAAQTLMQIVSQHIALDQTPVVPLRSAA